MTPERRTPAIPAPPAERSSPAKRPGINAKVSGYCLRKDRAASRSRPFEADFTNRRGGIDYQSTGIFKKVEKRNKFFRGR
jgi:hypothetical protein